MLDRSAVQDGHTVLEIGTWTCHQAWLEDLQNFLHTVVNLAGAEQREGLSWFPPK